MSRRSLQIPSGSSPERDPCVQGNLAHKKTPTPLESSLYDSELARVIEGAEVEVEGLEERYRVVHLRDLGDLSHKKRGGLADKKQGYLARVYRGISLKRNRSPPRTTIGP